MNGPYREQYFGKVKQTFTFSWKRTLRRMLFAPILCVFVLLLVPLMMFFACTDWFLSWVFFGNSEYKKLKPEDWVHDFVHWIG